MHFWVHVSLNFEWNVNLACINLLRKFLVNLKNDISMEFIEKFYFLLVIQFDKRVLILPNIAYLDIDKTLPSSNASR